MIYASRVMQFLEYEFLYVYISYTDNYTKDFSHSFMKMEITYGFLLYKDYRFPCRGAVLEAPVGVAVEERGGGVCGRQ